MNNKYFIDIHKGLRQCSDCLIIQPFSNYQSNGYSNTGKPRCRPCHRKYERQIKREKGLETRPHLFYQCDNEDCNHIWFKKEGMTCPECKEVKSEF